MNSESPKLLEVKRLTKRFAGTLALDAVDFEVRAGEVHALLGENGAGKSTLIKILAGVHRPDDGEIRLNGRVVDPLVDKLPITFIHQDLGLVDTMTVAENVAVLAGYPRRRGLISWAAARAAATAALERMGGGVDPERPGRRPSRRREIDRRDRPRDGGELRPAGARRADAPPCRRPTSRGCSTCCAGCARATSASSTSPTASTRSSGSPTGSRCFATAAG